MDEYKSSFQSRNWPVANGTILTSAVKRHVDVHGIPYSIAKIEYGYVVNAKRFENNKVVFGVIRGDFTWGDSAKKVAAWPKGMAAPVHYDPAQPYVSCLEPGGIGWEDCLLVIGLSIGLGCGTNTAAGLLGKLQAARQPAPPHFSSNPRSSREPGDSQRAALQLTRIS
jgi:hypothetical protein